MTNLLNLLGEQFTPELVQKAGSLVGESPSTTESALKVIGPLLLNGLLNKGASRSGADALLGALRQNNVDDSLLGNLGAILGGGESSNSLLKMGGALLPLLLGNKAGAAANILGSMLGLKGNSSSMLMSLVAPILGSVVSKLVKGQGLDAGGFANLLLGQKSAISAAMPAGFDSIFEPEAKTASTGSTGYSGGLGDRAASTAQMPAPVQSGGSPLRWLLPLIILAALAWLAWNFLGGSSVPEVPDVTNVVGDVKAVACAPIGTLESAISGLPALSADTPIADLQSGFSKIKDGYTALTAAVSALSNFDIGGLTDAYNKLESVITGLTGDTLGDGLAAVQTEVDAVKAAGTNLKSTVGCE